MLGALNLIAMLALAGCTSTPELAKYDAVCSATYPIPYSGAWREENPTPAEMPDTRADQPLSPKLESLARGEFIRPDLLSFFWGLIWLLPLAVVIPVLWVTLLCGPSPAQLRQ